jgi:hypothetical protein
LNIKCFKDKSYTVDECSAKCTQLNYIQFGLYDESDSCKNAGGIEDLSPAGAIPDIVDADPKMANVNLEDINTKLSKFRDKKVIALGNFPSKVLDKLGIDHLKIGHPSMRNRKWNDFHNVTMTLENMKDYLRGTH